jgi:hypothetical protein
MTRSARHALVAFLVVALVCCTSWGRPRTLSHAILDQRPSRLRVTLADRRQFDVEGPSARGDTLVGDTAVYLSKVRVDRRPVAIPFADVREVSTRGFAADKTIVLVVGVTAAVAVVAALVAESMKFGLGDAQGCSGPTGM